LEDIPTPTEEFATLFYFPPVSTKRDLSNYIDVVSTFTAIVRINGILNKIIPPVNKSDNVVICLILEHADCFVIPLYKENSPIGEPCPWAKTEA
jgi:hypothetical protein